MKHFSFFIALILLLLFKNLSAQDFTAGAMVGGNFNKTFVTPSASSQPYDGAMGLLFGIYGDYKRESILSLRSEINFLALGMKTPISTFHQNYLALSILPRLRLGGVFRLEVGVQGGLALKESLPDINRFHPIGLAGASWAFGRVETGLRYFQSFTPYYMEGLVGSERKFFYRGAQLIVGYRIL